MLLKTCNMEDWKLVSDGESICVQVDGVVYFFERSTIESVIVESSVDVLDCATVDVPKEFIQGLRETRLDIGMRACGTTQILEEIPFDLFLEKYTIKQLLKSVNKKTTERSIKLNKGW